MQEQNTEENFEERLKAVLEEVKNSDGKDRSVY